MTTDAGPAAGVRRDLLRAAVAFLSPVVHPAPRAAARAQGVGQRVEALIGQTTLEEQIDLVGRSSEQTELRGKAALGK